MKKRTVCLFVLISVILSACVYFSVPHEKKETLSPETGNTMSEMDQAFYNAIGNRKYREVPSTADFGSFLAALVAKTQNDFNQSADFYAKALKNDPESSDLITNTYLMYVLSGHVQEAVPYVITACEQNHEDILPRLVLFSDLIKQKKYKEARNLLAQKVSDKKNEFFQISLLPLLEAWTYVGENNKKRALTALEPLSKIQGFEIYYFLHKGLILDYFGENAKATKAFEQLLHLEKTPSLQSMLVIYSFFKRTNQLSSHSDFLKTYEEMQNVSFVSKDMMTNPQEKYRALSADDGVSMVFFDIGSLISQVDNYEVTLYLIQLALYLTPDSSIHKLFLAEVLEAMGQQEMANEVYLSVPRDKDLYRSMQLRLILSLHKMGRFEDAQKELTRLIDEFPNIPIYYMTQGDLFRDMQQYQKALDSYELSLQTFKLKEDPQVAILYFNMGVCYERLNQLDKTDELLQKAVSLNPQNPIYLNYLGYVWIERNKNLSQAIKMIQDAVKQLPDDGNILDSLGWAYYMIGDYQSALPIMEKAVEKEAGNAIINDHLGDLYWRLGRFREARFQWSHARSLKQSNNDFLKSKIDEKIEKGLPPINTNKHLLFQSK